MTISNLSQWTRLEYDKTPIYVRRDTPDWVVPNTAGDRLLQEIIKKEKGAVFGKNVNGNFSPEMIKATQFLSLFSSPSGETYEGRASSLCLEALDECWLHITDRCNLACSHCLFSCSPKTETTLSYGDVAQAVEASYSLGTRLYYLTGGEPLVHPNFQDICRLILMDHPDTRLVILTNGLLVPDHLDFFKTLPLNRLFLQISVDGIGEVNDKFRGKGTYQRLLASFSALCEVDIEITLSMAIYAGNYHQMPGMVALAAEYNFASIHYMWMFMVGRATEQAFVSLDYLFEKLVESRKKADQSHVTIDNIRNLSAQVFSMPGTKYDLSNAGWSSLAVGPDGAVYPTPALIGQAPVCCGNIKEESLESIWRLSPVLNGLRNCSVLQDEKISNNPLKYIIGGGDIDHSYYSGGSFIGHDPYVSLYDRMALWIMADSADLTGENRPWPQIRRKMGEKVGQCVQNGKGVALTHSNCVLTFTGTGSLVGDFYTAADESDNENIINPVCYPDAELQHIPVAARIRSYGCGSPVFDVGIMPGNMVVDLGSGAGVECYIAARLTGSKGHVVGVDMLDHMLNKARLSLSAVADNLGYRNVEFKKGYLEQIPVDDQTVDIIISNCVINLSEDKRKTFAEIFRILKPGGRICISDVVTDKPCPPSIQNDAKLRGECISGALIMPHLMAILEATGFHHIRIIKRYFYREVQGHYFYSVTYTAYKPPEKVKQRLVYPGPYAAVLMDTGKILLRGETTEADWPYPADNDTAIFMLDSAGSVSNIEAKNTCACSIPPETEKGCDSFKTDGITSVNVSIGGGAKTSSPYPMKVSPKSMADCMLCGKPLHYLTQDREESCVFCGKNLKANAVCEDGHFVCDLCHGSDMLEITKYICTHTDADDMIDLLNQLRAHPLFPLHGPEHHFTIPGVILAVYKNLGGAVTDEEILSAIDKGKSVPGGVCGFWGICGAAIAVGIAFGVILKSSPLAPKPRQQLQQITQGVIKKLSEYEAARCCQREAWTALLVAADLSEKYLPLKLKGEGSLQCRQQGKNKECIRQDCPYFKLD